MLGKVSWKVRKSESPKVRKSGGLRDEIGVERCRGPDGLCRGVKKYVKY